MTRSIHIMKCKRCKKYVEASKGLKFLFPDGAYCNSCFNEFLKYKKEKELKEVEN